MNFPGLYYVCGNEIIELDQLKELSWEPGLVSKVMGVNKEAFIAKSINEINICGSTPLVESKVTSDSVYDEFTITRRSAGLGESLLYVNNKQVKSYKENELEHQGDRYLLTVTYSQN